MSVRIKILRGLLYAALVLICATGVAVVAYVLLFRPWHLRWGATDAEVERPMPGDELVRNPDFNATRGVTIDARPEDIWPWLAQIGYKRAGWYSYDFIDNKGVPSAERIIPELQNLREGGEMPLGENTVMTVMAYEPPRYMWWATEERNFTWAWGLYPAEGGGTRLITRLRVKYHWAFPQIIGYFLIDVGDFFMMRKCMLNIKRRAEAAGVST